MPSKKPSELQSTKGHKRKSHKEPGSPKSPKTRSSKGRRRSVTVKSDPQSPSARSLRHELSQQNVLSKEMALSDDDNIQSGSCASPGSRDLNVDSPIRSPEHVASGPGSPAAKSPAHESTGRAFPELACAPESLQVKSLPPGRRRSVFRKDSDSDLYKHFTKEIDRVTEMSKSKMEEDLSHELGSDDKSRRRSERRASKAMLESPGGTKGSPGETKGAGRNFGGWWNRSRRALAFVAIFAILFLSASVVFMYVLKSKPTLQYGCTSAECVHFEEMLNEFLNPNIDPCEDFYSHVCGKWLTSSGQSYLDVVVNGFYRALNESIMKSTHEGDRYGLEAFVHLYRTCYEFMTTGILSLRAMVKTSISFLPYAEMTRSQSLPELWGYLVDIAVTRGIYAMFSVRYMYIGKRPTLHIASHTSIQGKIREVFVSVMGRRSEANFSLPQFEEYVREVLLAFYEESDAQQRARALAQWDFQSDALLQSHRAGQYMQFQDLANVTTFAALEHYMKVINNATPDSLHITMDEQVYVEGLEQIVSAAALAANHSLKWQGIYYVIHLVTDVARYAYLRQYTPEAKKAVERTCTAVTKTTLSRSWLYSVTRMIGNPTQAKRVKEIGDVMKAATIRSAGSWMDSFTKVTVASYIRNITVFTYQESELHESVANVDYNKLVHDETDDFAQFFWKLKAYEKTLVYQQIVPEQYLALNQLQLLAGIAYESRYRLLAVPTAFQRPPLYYWDESLPFYVNTATVGTLITRGLIRSAASHLTWSSKTLNKYQAYLACLKNVQRSLELKAQPEVDEMAWNRSVFSWTYASRIAHDQVKDAIMHAAGHSFQKDFDEAEHTFFVRFCMMFCARIPLPNEALHPREQCLIPLHSNPAFHEHYKCATKKSAVPRQPCISSLFA